jgi:predicted transcriptional regulator
MIDGRISGLPVIDDDGRLAGIVTEGDLLRRIELGTAPHHPAWLNFLRGPGLQALDYVRAHTLNVEDVMTPEPTVAEPESSLDTVVALMERNRVRRVPVVAQGKLVGIVSRSDLVRALGRMLNNAADGVRPDAAIRTDIIEELNHQGWYSMCNVTVAVKDGHVRLDGVAQSDTVHKALRVAAEGVAGVISVDNQVTLLDPMVTSIGA